MLDDWPHVFTVVFGICAFVGLAGIVVLWLAQLGEDE
jgi:hypothetical protein